MREITADDVLAGSPPEIASGQLIAVLGLLGFDAAVAENAASMELGPDGVAVLVWAIVNGEPTTVAVAVPVRQQYGPRESILEAWQAGAAIDRSGFGS